MLQDCHLDKRLKSECLQSDMFTVCMTNHVTVETSQFTLGMLQPCMDM